MRVRAPAIAAGLILAIAAMRVLNLDLSPTESNTPVVAACTVQGMGCAQPSLDGGGQFVISHQVLRGGCSAAADLHVMRYISPSVSSSPLIATWCG